MHAQTAPMRREQSDEEFPIVADLATEAVRMLRGGGLDHAQALACLRDISAYLDQGQDRNRAIAQLGISQDELMQWTTHFGN
jgi:hypothetical protein